MFLVLFLLLLIKLIYYLILNTNQYLSILMKQFFNKLQIDIKCRCTYQEKKTKNELKKVNQMIKEILPDPGSILKTN